MNYINFTFVFFFLISGELAFGKLKVVTTFSVIEDLVKVISEDRVDTLNLVPAGEDPHLFEPKPRDIENVKSTDLIFANGLMFEPWLNKLISTSKSKAKISIISYRIKSRQLMEEGHSIIDPHAWNSPLQIIKYIEAIEERLSIELPKEKTLFQKNANQLKNEINVIYKTYSQFFNNIPSEKKVILTTHEAGFYLCEDFGIKSLSPLGLSTSEEFRTKDLSELLENIKKHSIKVIFTEKNHHQILTEKISNKAKLVLGKPLYFDGLSVKTEPASTVIKMLNYNLEQIKNSME